MILYDIPQCENSHESVQSDDLKTLSSLFVGSDEINVMRNNTAGLNSNFFSQLLLSLLQSIV